MPIYAVGVLFLYIILYGGDLMNLRLYVRYDKDKNKTCCCQKYNPLCNYYKAGVCQQIKTYYNPFKCIKED